jgi:hypothetical protein
MFERFTGQARRVLWLAYQEAQRFDHDFLGAEHLLVGVLREGSDDVLAILRRHGVDREIALAQLDPLLLAADPNPMGGKVYLTPRVRRILADAIESAGRQHLPQAGVNHLFAALLTDPESDTQRLLHDLGVDVASLRSDLEQLPVPTNRDLAVQSRRGDSEPGRIDPSPEQIAQLLNEQMPHVELPSASAVAVGGQIPGVAELDWQLLLTQLVLAVSCGMMGGYLLFRSTDGMAGVTSLFFVVAIFRSSLLGAIAGGLLGWFIARDHDPFDGFSFFLLPVAGMFIGSFLGNFWRRYCPFVIKPGEPPPRPRVP